MQLVIRLIIIMVVKKGEGRSNRRRNLVDQMEERGRRSRRKQRPVGERFSVGTSLCD